MRCVKLLIAVIFPLAISLGVNAQQGHTKLIWAEEFNSPGLPDQSRWSYDTGRGCPHNCGWGNNEHQYYTTRAKNAVVEDGVLKIKAYREVLNGADYTSARLVTKNKFNTRYGRIEVRARVPEGIGTWPAIWMLGANIDKTGWPACGEIDIMEHKGSEPNKIFGTLHYPGHSGDRANGKSVMLDNATKAFQVYSAEWNETAIKIYANDKLVHEVPLTKEMPFHHEFYLLLNLAIGGGFAGPVDPAFREAIFEVDYVRVYQ